MKKNVKYRYQKKNILRHLTERSLGYMKTPSTFENVDKHLPSMWKEKYFQTEKHNKIFASQWISNDSVVYGTKCNKLYWLNVVNQKYFSIPLIHGITREDQNPNSDEPSTHFGIHSIKKNINETLLATGGDNVNSVGIYKIPEFKPVFLLENFHFDAVFDICWLDDAHVATCSRDAKMGIWNLNQDDYSQFDCLYGGRSADVNDTDVYENSLICALHQPQLKLCFEGISNRFRAMEYLSMSNRLLIATMSNKLYSVDPTRLCSTDVIQSQSSQNSISNNSHNFIKTTIQDMVAIRKWPAQPHSFAVGGQARFTIYDSRAQNETMNVLALNHNAGIRSLAFKDAVVSYGTAEGHINFFDLRAHRHLEVESLLQGFDRWSSCDCVGSLMSCYHPPVSPLSIISTNATNLIDTDHAYAATTHNHVVQLRMEGVVEQNDAGRPVSCPQTAIYTHEYDPTQTKLFAAGGPIAACYTGQAACLFE